MNLGVTSLAATERRIVEDGEILLDGASRRFQLKPKPTIVSPRSATQRPSGSSARQHFGNATDGGAGDGRAPWRTRNSLPASCATRSASSESSNFASR